MKLYPYLAVAFAALISGTPDSASAEVKNIVIVHGAFADSSGWRSASDILVKRGFNVTLVQNPLTSLQDDVEATQRVLDMQSGPSLLVGHSYGGMVITAVGNHAKVSGLVYVAAFQPDTGESLLTLATRTPPAGTGIKATGDGQFLYLDPAVFAAEFAADLPPQEAAFLARSQVFASKQAFSTPVDDPAWKHKPTWAIVATDDKSINPELERTMAKRAGSKVTEIKGSHAIFMSQPEKVADTIAAAARSLNP